jgi:hypothetical protein
VSLLCVVARAHRNDALATARQHVPPPQFVEIVGSFADGNEETTA